MITCIAHAKVNLALAVAQPRADGLHPICSWFAPIELSDSLHIEALAAGEQSRYTIEWSSDAPRPSAIDWPIEKDLAVRAHRLIEREAGRSLPIAMRLVKRIPVGGGLGGGSSDAAAMIRGLVRLFDLRLERERLHTLALALGSDVPYFLLDPLTPAVVEEVGQRLVPAPGVRGDLTLILPPFGCPTGAVYRAFDAMPAGAFRDEAVRRMSRRDPIDRELFNDLATAAERVEPRLATCRAAAERALARPVHITGSGSTMFALGAFGIDVLSHDVVSCMTRFHG